MKGEIIMFEKVNPQHPDKVADRIAGAVVDLCYKMAPKNIHHPTAAVEVLIGHGSATVIVETNIFGTPKQSFKQLSFMNAVNEAAQRISGISETKVKIAPQDEHLANNQEKGYRCGDNGIFKGARLTDEQELLTNITKSIYESTGSDGKNILDINNNKLIICQSNLTEEQADMLKKRIEGRWDLDVIINPLGPWIGGPDVDSGATNRKLGSDMADSVTGGGIHGKDCSKADVSVNIYAFLRAYVDSTVEVYCAIGDETVDGIPYSNIVKMAEEYIGLVGGFEAFAEWGLLNPYFFKNNGRLLARYLLNKYCKDKIKKPYTWIPPTQVIEVP